MGYARYLDSRLKNSNPAAHAAVRLVLLGSPPDTVHGAALRGTGLSSLLIQGRRHIIRPGAGIHPRCSGLRVQGTAISPTSAALLRAEAQNRAVNIVLYLRTIINQNFFALCWDEAGHGSTPPGARQNGEKQNQFSLGPRLFLSGKKILCRFVKHIGRRTGKEKSSLRAS